MSTRHSEVVFAVRSQQARISWYLPEPNLLFRTNNQQDSVLFFDYDIVRENAASLHIDVVFNKIRSDLNTRPHSFSISYDPDFSFPDEYYVDFVSGLADDEYSISISDFKIINLNTVAIR